jgi:hypothetical protein
MRDLNRPPRAVFATALLATLSPLVGCSAFRAYHEPVPLAEVGMLERAVTETEGGLTVKVAVPSREETKDIFGTSLYVARIQPVWVEVVNEDDSAYLLMRTGMDPKHYSPLEAAYSRRTTSKRWNEALDTHFEALAFDAPILPGETVQGFVFTRIDEGQKSVVVDLLGDKEVHSFSFTIPIPGLVTDVERVDFSSLYEEYRKIENEEELRQSLSELPATTSNKAGSRAGDPLNVVLVGSHDDIFSALIRRDWHQTEVTYARSAWKTFKSFLFGSQYLYSPISPLYVFGRPQDIGLQKARGSIHVRNHMRLWLTDIDYRGQSVWLGQISRDIGVKFTTSAPTLTTHAIDPDVDDTRGGLTGDLAYSQAMTAVGYVPGAPISPRSAPHANLTGDAYYTDGLRAVMFIGRQPLGLDEIDILDWEFPRGLDEMLSH